MSNPIPTKSEIILVLQPLVSPFITLTLVDIVVMANYIQIYDYLLKV